MQQRYNAANWGHAGFGQFWFILVENGKNCHLIIHQGLQTPQISLLIAMGWIRRRAPIIKKCSSFAPQMQFIYTSNAVHLACKCSSFRVQMQFILVES
ncbi:hypothetical protein D0T85_05940 [Bacteroides sp. 519]|nr:hypothetical protein [Bacteroides sp. 519]